MAESVVSVVIVLYNSAEYIEPCLESLSRSEGVTLEIVLVDNASSDSSSLLARRCLNRLGMTGCISMMGRNKGFAAACNAGARAASGEVILFLNPDTEVYGDMIGELVRAFTDGSLGVCGCKVYYPDRKTLQHAGGWMRDNGLTMHYGVGEEDAGAYDEPRDCFYVTGCALAVRGDVFERSGGLDEGYYPAYFEEADLCLNVRRLGYRVTYVPEARVVHHESVSTGKFTRRYYYLYHKNRLRFLIKNFSLRFLRDRTVPMEREWHEMIKNDDQTVPLNKAYAVNVLALPRTLTARLRNELRLRSPRIEDTVSHLK